MSFKPLFARSLGAAPGRLHMAAHSHHLWPDASRSGQIQCWDDAARLADYKWDRIMGEVWPMAQREIAQELGTEDPSAIVFAGNTHDFIVRLVSACPRSGDRLRILTSDGEFHSARRQFARWTESGEVEVTAVAAEPFDDFADRFLQAAQSGKHDLVFVSHTLFGSGRIFDRAAELSSCARPEGPWVVIDGYHSFMALDHPFPGELPAKAFFLAGGYKYAMAGEGMAFLHCPPGYGPRPPITGWYAEFADLTLAPGLVGYSPDAMRFMGATFDASALYRFNAVRAMLAAEGLTTSRISTHVAALQARLLQSGGSTVLGEAELLNPLVEGRPHARFLALRDRRAASWCAALQDRGIVTDVRGDVLRIGLGLYHDESDVDGLVKGAKALR